MKSAENVGTSVGGSGTTWGGSSGSYCLPIEIWKSDLIEERNYDAKSIFFSGSGYYGFGASKTVATTGVIFAGGYKGAARFKRSRGSEVGAAAAAVVVVVVTPLKSPKSPKSSSLN